MPRAPVPYILRLQPPAALYRALTTGAMRAQGETLQDSERRAVAEYLSGRKLNEQSDLEPPLCGADIGFDAKAPPAFPGWGLTPENTRYVSTAAAGIGRANVGQLKLQWAVGFAGATRARSEPAIAGGALIVGSADGTIYALDLASGCKRWVFQVGSEVRTGVVVSPWVAGDATAQPLAYFGDVVGNLYAVNARTGALAWRDRADLHPSTTLTAAPVLHDGLLYQAVSSLEEGAADGTHECCTFRGSLIAYDARTGERRWQTFMTEPPTQRGKDTNGRPKWGPSGVALWNSPAIDTQRGLLYIATGDNYSDPVTAMSDAVVAMDLKTGKIRWVYQATANDGWNVSCIAPDRANCPESAGPDFDFGASPILMQATNGKQYVLAGQKSGTAYAIDPDTGQLVWKHKVGRGGIMAGIYFGMAAGDDRVYVPVNDAADGQTYDFPDSPGLYALDLHTGAFVWKQPYTDAACAGRGPACGPGINAAVTATDQLVFAGAGDGWLRAHDAATGALLWSFDTAGEFKTVGGGLARGGSMGGGAGPVLSNGYLIMPSGYGFAGRMPGNVMLVFKVQ